MQKLSIQDYEVLHTQREDQYDEILQLAALNLNCKYAALSIKNDNGFWLKSKIGFNFNEISHDDSFWKYHPGNESDLLIIEDVRKIEGLKDNILVSCHPYVVSYTGSPIIAKNGEILGVLSIFDNKPRSITPDQQTVLKILSKQILRLIEAGEEEKRLKDTKSELQETRLQLKESEKYYKSLIDNAGDIFYEIT
ncbi:MAG: GAF domain-containing protein, partial [Cyclobacteriaceae bacterium]